MSLLVASRAYRIRAVINGETDVEQFQENSNYSQSSTFGNTQTFQVDRELRLGDVLSFTDHYTNNYYYDYTDVKCKTKNVEHSCSYVTGKLIKKLWHVNSYNVN